MGSIYHDLRPRTTSPVWAFQNMAPTHGPYPTLLFPSQRPPQTQPLNVQHVAVFLFLWAAAADTPAGHSPDSAALHTANSPLVTALSPGKRPRG